MKSAIDRLRFAVDFIQKNIKMLRPGDKLNLRDDLKAFFGSDLNGLVAQPNSDPMKASDDQLLEIQEQWRVLLRQTAQSRQPYGRSVPQPPRSGLGTRAPIVQSGILAPMCITIDLLPIRTFAGDLLFAQGGLRDVALFLLIQCVMQAPPNALARCADPHCPMLFVRTRRQRFHHRSCAIRSAVSALRQRQKEQLSKRQKRRGVKLGVELPPKPIKKHRKPRKA